MRELADLGNLGAVVTSKLQYSYCISFRLVVE